MKIPVITLDAADAGEADLDDAVFGVTDIRRDILHRVVRWQLARRQAGTHKVKTRSEVSYSGRKIYRQKGTGGARHGARSAPIFRHGGVYKGPKVRSHAHELTKKVRSMGLRHALSSKVRADRLVVIDAAQISGGKTKDLAAKIKKLGWGRALVIDGAEIDANFGRVARNIVDFDVLPSQGANVYDILGRDTLVITRAGLDGLHSRLSPASKAAAVAAEAAE